jgi:mono/diheme cytochrome c family protein
MRGLVTTSAILLGLAVGSSAAFAAGKGDAAKGKDTVEGQCTVCHNTDSTEKKMGPGLKGLYKNKVLVNGKPVTDANVLDKINQGGNGMPGYQDMLSADEKANILAYLHTL